MTKPRKIIAIDQSTTSSKAILMDHRLQVLAHASFPFAQHFPFQGAVEHDPDEIWETVQKALRKILKGVDVGQIAAIGLTNQRETTCFWNKKTGKSLGRAIVWQDRRTADFCQALKDRGEEEFFRSRTGLLLDPYFSGTKIRWAIQNLPSVQKALAAGELAVGTIDSYILFKLTGEHRTEPSNASRTFLFDIHRKSWSAELCQKLEVPPSILPQVQDSIGVFGRTRGVRFLGDGVPVAGILGDQQSALFGQGCLEAGQAKCTYGTGAFLLLNTGSKAVESRNRLLTTIAWSIKGQTTYALEGSLFIAGAAVQWLRDGLGLIKKAEDIEALARSVKNSGGVIFVPALTGLGAPHWDPQATGMFTGLTRATTRAHLARAVLEGVAFQGVDILKAMQSDVRQAGGEPLRQLNVDGGASQNNLLMQIQSDVLDVTLVRPKFEDTTILGAVFAAGLGVGIWKEPHEILRTWKKDRVFVPKIDRETRTAQLANWNRSVRQVMLK